MSHACRAKQNSKKCSNTARTANRRPTNGQQPPNNPQSTPINPQTTTKKYYILFVGAFRLELGLGRARCCARRLAPFEPSPPPPQPHKPHNTYPIRHPTELKTKPIKPRDRPTNGQQPPNNLQTTPQQPPKQPQKDLPVIGYCRLGRKGGTNRGVPF